MKTKQQVDFVPTGWQTIAVLPFAGDARFTEESARTLVTHLQNGITFRLVPPEDLGPAVRRLGIVIPSAPEYRMRSGPVEIGISVADARKVGQAVHADAVIIGLVMVLQNGSGNEGICMAQLIDVASGTIAGSSTNPIGIRPGSSERECAHLATTRTATAMRTVLTNLEQQNLPSLKTETTTATQRDAATDH